MLAQTHPLIYGREVEFKDFALIASAAAQLTERRISDDVATKLEHHHAVAHFSASRHSSVALPDHRFRCRAGMTPR